MTDSFVTQCPHCQTSFRVSRAQLAVAHGAVRCGACLHVFNAAQQLLAAKGEATLAPPPATKAKAPAPAAPQAPAAPMPSVAAVLRQPQPHAAPLQPTATPVKPSGDTLWIHDDLDLDSLDLDEELAKLEQEEQRLSRDLLGPNAPTRGEPQATPRHDEGWAEALLEAEERKSPLIAEAELTAEPEPEPEADFDLRAEPELQAPAQGPDTEPAPRTEPSLSMDLVEDEPGPDFSLGPARDDERDDLDDEPDDLDPPHTAEPVRQQVHQRSEPGLRDDGLLNLNDEPLQLDWQESRRPWGRWIGWLLLNLIAIIALGTQYVWYHFNELARQDQYRPWFQQICPEIGCKLPSKVDIELIKSSNLVVRSHPEFSGALVVDAILYNRAAFAQPFPLLELRFADINGQLLASRRFKPGEYLSGELAGQAEMPPQTPIHISLDILDPGTKAVNYSLSFHSPE
ncbi:DUF3426 domain-containing protein [Metapseudomonas resinovorans]|uniref:Zinc finger/thioredoxin putative domain-containing protein n=1 Tax=Metapseudomonas resinovorans NBRC 106553 TaxID=1245471 RepID=S6BP65_METRE|nr:DUF3426 domain-containing protein [Pseudomonas resinovorans]BAN50829.1 hypothetical protein PCA10_50970 [Pseudomonas resinovorans NBRC 106553]